MNVLEVLQFFGKLFSQVAHVTVSGEPGYIWKGIVSLQLLGRRKDNGFGQIYILQECTLVKEAADDSFTTDYT